jgi:hypothetical protein
VDDRPEPGLTATRPSSFGEDSCGRVYVAELGDGSPEHPAQVSRIVGDEPTDCDPGPDPGGGDPGGGDPGGGADPGGGDPGDGDPPPPAQDRPPELELTARDPQGIGDGELVARLSSNEAADVVARLALLDGRRVKLRAGEKSVELGAGERAKVTFKVGRADRRKLRGARRDGDLKARFRARATDGAGKRSGRAEVVSNVG